MRIEQVCYPNPDMDWSVEDYQCFIDLALCYDFQIIAQDENTTQLSHIDGSTLQVTKHEVIYRRKRKKHTWNGYKSTPFKEFKKSRENINKILKNAQI